MRLPFLKMHGAGNDFIVVDERQQGFGLTPALIAALADRHTGIGCDQLVVIGRHETADARVRFFNPDGGEAGACGNGTRCVADLLMRETGCEAGRDTLVLRTIAGALRARRLADGRICVDMGEPSLAWQDVPLAGAMDTLYLPLPGEPAALSMGNPHATFFTDSPDAAAERGPAVEHDPLFPDGVNAGFVQVLAPDRLRLRVWERGAGLTLACGSGACAALVNAHRRGLAGRSAAVVVDGGVLDITWRADNHVEMIGPVATTFEGVADLSAYTRAMSDQRGWDNSAHSLASRASLTDG